MGATRLADEHRIGLKPVLRRVWAPRGQRPIARVRHRFAWRYLVGFVHPASGRTLFHLATSVSIALFAVAYSIGSLSPASLKPFRRS